MADNNNNENAIESAGNLLARITPDELVVGATSVLVCGATDLRYLPFALLGLGAMGQLRRSRAVNKTISAQLATMDYDREEGRPVVGRLLSAFAISSDETRLALPAPKEERHIERKVAPKPTGRLGKGIKGALAGFAASLSYEDDSEVVSSRVERRRAERAEPVAEAAEASVVAQDETEQDEGNWLRQPGATGAHKALGTLEVVRGDDGKVKNQRKLMRDAAARLPEHYLLEEMHPPRSTTAFPVGVTQDGDELWFDLRPGQKNHVNFVSLTGAPNAGKDTMFKSWYRTLCHRNSPQEIRFVFVDGKGPWYAPSLRKSPYALFPFENWDGETAPVMKDQMKRLQAEMKRRYRIIVEENECEDLEEYVEETGDTSMPYIVLVVTDVLGDLTGEVENLLTQIVAKGRACGMRAWVSMQTTVGESSKWRSLMTAYISGPVQGPQSDQVVMGLEGAYLAYRPSLMDTEAKGIFCVRYGPREWLVRGAWQDKAEFKAWYRAIYADLTGEAPEQATRSMQAIRTASEGDEAHRKYAEWWADASGVSEETTRTMRMRQAQGRVADWSDAQAEAYVQEMLRKRGEVTRSVNHKSLRSDGEVTSTSALQEVQTSPQQDANFRTSQSAEASLQKAVLTFKSVPEGEREKLRSALKRFTENGQKVTDAVEFGFGNGGGPKFKERSEWLRAAYTLYLASTAKK